MQRRGALVVVGIVLALSACAARRQRIEEIAKRLEAECLAKGWQRIEATLAGRTRQIMWKGPARWEHGAILVFHGGGGVYSNVCASYLSLDEPMARFGARAVAEGFGVVALDSTEGLVKDAKGFDCGKRWDALAHDRPNVDLPAIEEMITTVIPKIRPEGSSGDVFMTGISNGGFMTILAATRLARHVTAFAPISAGDPYGTYVECESGRLLRPTAPGVFKDRATRAAISDEGAGGKDGDQDEQRWPEARATMPAFKQFHHESDGAVDLSVMRKAQRTLAKHGFRDAGPVLLGKGGRRRFTNHFWQDAYNEPILRFFKERARTKK